MIIKTVGPSADWMQEVIYSMRNPKNSWDKMDTWATNNNKLLGRIQDYNDPRGQNIRKGVGNADFNLMRLLINNPCERKFLREIPVMFRLKAPMLWWKEADTYKIGTVRNSCSTMHKITSKEFTKDDFTNSHIKSKDGWLLFEDMIFHLNNLRNRYLELNEEIKQYSLLIQEHSKEYYQKRIADDIKERDEIWRELIDCLGSNYLQQADLMMNLETFLQICIWRSNHKLEEWRTFVTEGTEAVNKYCLFTETGADNDWAHLTEGVKN